MLGQGGEDGALTALNPADMKIAAAVGAWGHIGDFLTVGRPARRTLAHRAV